MWNPLRRRNQQIERELRFHVDSQIRDYVAQGLSEREARRRARLDFGGHEQAKDACRDVGVFGILDWAVRDLRHAIRRLGRHPGYAATVIATLGLGIGAATAVYSIVDSILIEPLPYPDSDRFVRLVEIVAPAGSFSGTATTYTTFPVGNLPGLETRLDNVSDVAGYRPVEMTVTGLDRPFRLSGAWVSPAMFSLLDVVLPIGRGFAPDEFDAVVISDGVWRNRFGGQRDVLGRNFVLDGQPFSVVGVLPPALAFPTSETEFWIPLRPLAMYEDAQGIMRSKATDDVSVIARLERGVSLETAAAEVGLVLGGLRREAIFSRFRPTEDVDIRLVRLKDEIVEPVRPALLALLGAVGFVLIITCTNVAALGLARAARQERETAIRAALGGGKRALLFPGLVESVILAIGGGILGTFLAYAALDVVRDSEVSSLPRTGDISLDGSALGFALALSVLTGLAIGLAPARSLFRIEVHTLIQESVGAASSGLRPGRRYRARTVLVVAQVAMTAVLLVGAGLLIRSFISLSGTEPGYDAENLVAFHVMLPARIQTMTFGGDIDRTVAIRLEGSRFPLDFAGTFLSRMENSPDIASAGVIWGLPTEGSGSTLLEGLPLPMEFDSGSDRALFRIVSAGAFGTMGMEIVAGRGFDPADSAGSPRVVAINEALERRYFAAENPLGRTVRVQGYAFDWEIVGVVTDIIPSDLTTVVQPEVYFHLPQTFAERGADRAPLFFFQTFTPNLHFVARTRAEPASAVPVIREILEDIEPLAAISVDVRTMEQRLWESVRGPRFYALTMGSFAAVALLLAGIGLYSILSQTVTDSTRTIGIQMAVGADRTQVVAGVLRQAAVIVGVGLVLGLAASVAVARLLESALFGLTPLDPTTYFGVILLLLAVAGAATWIPARRATRVDPMIALRYE